MRRGTVKGSLQLFGIIARLADPVALQQAIQATPQKPISFAELGRPGSPPRWAAPVAPDLNRQPPSPSTAGAALWGLFAIEPPIRPRPDPSDADYQSG
jgi:hypothetical protein